MPLMPSPDTAVGHLKPAPFVLCPACPEALGLPHRVLNLTAPGQASAAWPTTDLGIGYPFVLSEARTALGMWGYNGANVTQNRDLGIYDAAGNRLVSIGTTAGSGANVLQLYDTTDIVLAPHTTYYAWLSSAGTTSSFFRWAGSTNVTQVAALGVVQAASVFVLPSTITYAALAVNYLPVFGVRFAAVM